MLLICLEDPWKNSRYDLLQIYFYDMFYLVPPPPPNFQGKKLLTNESGHSIVYKIIGRI